jgi:hypothetical protein
MRAIEILTNIGLPSAIIGMIVIAFLFRKEYKKIVKAALIIALILATLLGVAQIIYHFNLKVDRIPHNVYAIATGGNPVELKIEVKVGDKILKSDIITKPDSVEYENRPLKVINNDLDNQCFNIGYYGNQVGRVFYDELTSQGWRKFTGTSETPRFWTSYRIYLGKSHDLKQCEYGKLSIKFYSVKSVIKEGKEEGVAEVSLFIEGRETPNPATVLIQNKGVGQQDFVELPTFYIAIREANFTEGWIAVNIYTVG